jgi:hypothetical protein
MVGGARPLHRLRRSPSPAPFHFAGAHKQIRSRGAFFAPEFCQPYLVTAGLDPAVHTDLRHGKPHRQIRVGFPFAWIAGSSPAMTKARNKREAERRQTHCLAARTQAACGTRHEKRAACATLRLRARSPAGVPRRFSPKGLSSRGLSFGPGFPKAARKAAACRTRRLGHSEAPRAPVVVPAGMMPEPPGCGPYPSARGRRARSATGEYPYKKLCGSTSTSSLMAPCFFGAALSQSRK